MAKENKKFSEKDVSVVIATYCRPEEMDRTLSKLIENSNLPGQIVVVDQSPDDKTKKVCQKYSKSLPI
ncbi:MAG: glycosyltransferase, partial [archaeon]